MFLTDGLIYKGSFIDGKIHDKEVYYSKNQFILF